MLEDAFCYMDNKNFEIIKNNMDIFMSLVSKLNLEEDIDSKLTILHNLWREEVDRFCLVEHIGNIYYYVIVNYDTPSSMFKVYIDKKSIDSDDEKKMNEGDAGYTYITEAEYKLIAKAIDIELKKMLLDKVKELNRLTLTIIE